jgi:phage recombination protein Bet
MTLSLATPNVDPAVAAAMDLYARLQVVKQTLAPDLSDAELQLFAFVANRSGLDPFAKQVYAVKRAGKVTFQTGIDGYRSTAERTGEYDGSDEPEFGPDKDGHPEWARVTVYRYRNGRRVGQSATAFWAEFHPGQDGTGMWKKMPRNQLAKCAEALALRKAFPFVLADLYTSEEMDQADAIEGTATRVVAPTAAERIAARRAQVEAKPTVEGEVVSETPVATAPDPTAVETCGDEDASPMGLGYCSQSKGHKGAHKSDAGTWP